MFLFLLILIQYLLVPLLFPFISVLLYILIPFVRRRIQFERLNQSFIGSKSFKEDNLIAKIALEVSSEGELEQVRPVIDSFIEKGERVEIIYSSDSVEGNALKLYKGNPDNVRIFRMPLLTYLPFIKSRSVAKWMTASTLVLCRYDFYPELLLIGLKKNIKFILLQASLISRGKLTQKGIGVKNYIFKKIYQSFDEIVCSTANDLNNFHKFFDIKKDKLTVAELRILQIQKRLDLTYDKLMKYPFWPVFSDFISSKHKKDLILFGNFWPNEALIFNNDGFVQSILKKKSLPVIVPHVLKEENLDSINYEILKLQKGLNIYKINAVDSEEHVRMVLEEFEKNPGIIMLNCKGILVELYSFFNHAYVGGGFGKSIHSVLEPYLGNSRIYVGPKHHKSTEFLVAKENSPDEVHVLNKLETFFDEYMIQKDKKNCLDDRVELVCKTKPFLNDFLLKIMSSSGERDV